VTTVDVTGRTGHNRSSTPLFHHPPTAGGMRLADEDDNCCFSAVRTGRIGGCLAAGPRGGQGEWQCLLDTSGAEAGQDSARVSHSIRRSLRFAAHRMPLGEARRILDI